jgi:outer membrane protein assembly factor BamB
MHVPLCRILIGAFLTSSLVVASSLDPQRAGTTPGQSKPQPIAQPASENWPQWGGPRRDFTATSTGLVTSWPEGGPRRLWSRPLGAGHSAISAVDGRLFTIYRPLVASGHAQEEIVVALDANTGATIWEHRFASPEGLGFGPYMAPHTTPLVAGDRVYAAGSRKQLFALDKATGRVIWSRHLIKEFLAPEGDRGYAASPLMYAGRLIVSLGGSHQSLAAFDAATGALVWKAGNLAHSPASPTLIEMNGQPQVVYLGGQGVAGFDPTTGRELWQHPHSTTNSLNISMPLWSPADRSLFISAGYGTGSRMVELQPRGARTVPVQRWYNHRVSVHFSNAVRVGSLIIGSDGDFGPMFLTAMDVASGAIAWQDRTFTRSQLLVADGKLLILDEDGNLGLATVTPKGLQIHGRARILEPVSWTPPTLVGTRVYVRDRRTIAAYELGK